MCRRAVKLKFEDRREVRGGERRPPQNRSRTGLGLGKGIGGGLTCQMAEIGGEMR